MAKHRQTKACDISAEVKEAVYERDDGLCIICNGVGAPNAHYIPRSAGGLGIEQNIVTLCHGCHYQFDQTIARSWLKRVIADYLKSCYPGWNEADLYYKKYQ
jgi:5-methylcytosine-specific restriction endonuclease McrA